MVLEKWIYKLGFFFWSTTFLQPEKRWIHGIKPPFFLVNHFSQTRFLEPDFSNHFSRTTFLHFLEKWLQIKWSSAFVLVLKGQKFRHSPGTNSKFCLGMGQDRILTYWHRMGGDIVTLATLTTPRANELIQ